MNPKLFNTIHCGELTSAAMPDRESAHPRDRKRIASAKRVVARLEVRLASGEPNGILQITRSVICLNPLRTRSVLNSQMREQSPSTTVRDTCRAFEQISDTANARTQNQRTN